MLGESLAKIKRGERNSLCSQSRTHFMSRAVRGELSIKPKGKTATNFEAVYVHA